MRKKAIVLISLVLVLGLLIGGALLALKIKKPADVSSGASSTIEIPVLTLTADNINEINVITKEENYTLKRKDATSFLFADKQGLLLDATQVSSYITELSSIVATSSASKAPTSLIEYGLDKPSTTVNILQKDGSIVKILVGNKTALGAYFLKTSLSDEVFVVDTYKAESFTAKKLSFYSKTLPTGLTQDNFISLKIEKPSQDTISIVKSGTTLSSDQATAGMIAYVLDKPISSDVDSDVFSSIITNLTSLLITDNISDDFSKANLKKYGLDVPKYTFSYSFDINNVILLIGNENSDGNYYCILKGTQLVYSISKTSLSFLDFTVSKFANKLQYLTNIKDVNAVKIEGQGKSYNFQLIGSEGDNMQVKYNDKDMPVDDFKTLYQTIIGVYQNQYIPNKPKGNAEITITFTLKNGKTDVLSYIPYDFLDYFFAVNGEGKFTVSRDSVLKILSNAEKYIKGEKISA